MSDQNYVALVVDEPIPGVPSHRIYGPFERPEDVWDGLARIGLNTREGRNLIEGVTSGVLMLRPADQLERETPR